MPFDVVFWHWWSLGAILLIVELLVPGMFFIWMGESAFVVGAVVWLYPLKSNRPGCVSVTSLAWLLV